MTMFVFKKYGFEKRGSGTMSLSLRNNDILWVFYTVKWRGRYMWTNLSDIWHAMFESYSKDKSFIR